MASFLLRATLETDIAGITAVYRPAVLCGTASFELEPPDAAEMARRHAAITAAGYPYLVAVDAADGRVLGYAYVSAYRPRPAYRHVVENSVYVAPEAHRRGVGRALLTRLIADCEAKGFRQMIAVIGDSGHASSIGLHRSLGFVHCGVVRSVGFKHGRWLDQVLLQRSLGAGDTALPPA